MQLGIGSHLDDADLEQYSMGKLPEVRLVPFEEHLLACEACQDRLLEMEAFVNAVRSVSPKLRAASSSPRRNRFRQRPTWVAAFAMGVVLLGLGRIWLVARRAPMDFAAVVLQSGRGIEGLAVAKAPAGKAPSLILHLAPVPTPPAHPPLIAALTGETR